MNATRPLPTLLGLLALATLGCAASAEPAEGEPVDTQDEGQAVLAERSFMLRDGEVDGVEVAGKDIRFPRATGRVRELRAGDVVASSASGASFVRRVVSVATEGDRVVLTTEDAALADMAKELRTRKRISLPEAAADVSGKALVGDASLGVVCSTCALRFSPTLDLGIDFRRGRLDHFVAEFDGALTADLEVSAIADKGLSVSRELDVYKTTAHLVQWVGPVPVWEDVTVAVSARLDAGIEGSARAKAGVHVERHVRGGIQFDGSEWSHVADTGEVVVKRGASIEVAMGGSAKLTLVPRVEVALYSAAAAYVEGEAWLSAKARLCPAPASYGVEAGLTMSVGAEARFFGATAGVRRELFRATREIARGELPGSPACGAATP